jgi:SAM-dependent methyltransferase
MDTSTAKMNPEMESLKTRLKTTWMSGDYGHFSQYLDPGRNEIFERLNVTPGMRVLDVACGAGQFAVLAARAGAHATGVDIATNLLKQARARAASEGLSVQFDEGDAEMLPYEDASFDLVVSLIGAMFAPRPELVASELVRVCRPGGRIVMANWTPTGFIGRMFKLTGKHAPPPAMPSPVLWGDEATVRERLRDGIKNLEITKRMWPFNYPFPPAEVVEFFRMYYGPMNRAFASLDANGQAALRQDLDQLWSTNNRATDGSTHVDDAEYLEVIATRG